ncbi:hypothetical protein MCOR27_009777 [Pyricularia oryzae]|uniref:Uncharacterized protein n=1 Tax=Pyricularia grisea TaxID=148305 RepID=A0ABQ8NZ58_PYRGI|nr:hypothetical protein MCOR01_010187 [Pyricularia oryzae]KAI6304048.1 hypothetical protein MCOR33_000794 [Pyricularia grisea]KAI6255363.1 hypothetical protein MCOR19_008118 [Pyricularia oryzae]KAI6269325.1 hypothetical protein MCOR26_008757 [Pyricularia oryzae]KAI6269366.1 hypothetical protein MCOR27_009777 [Pyricularia oryzae]
MKISALFMFAVSLTLGAATEAVFSNGVHAELATRGVQLPAEGRYLAKRVVKLLRRKAGSSSSKPGSYRDTTGDVCFIGFHLGLCDGLGTCTAGGEKKETAFCI